MKPFKTFIDEATKQIDKKTLARWAKDSKKRKKAMDTADRKEADSKAKYDKHMAAIAAKRKALGLKEHLLNEKSFNPKQKVKVLFRDKSDKKVSMNFDNLDKWDAWFDKNEKNVNDLISIENR